MLSGKAVASSQQGASFSKRVTPRHPGTGSSPFSKRGKGGFGLKPLYVITVTFAILTCQMKSDRLLIERNLLRI